MSYWLVKYKKDLQATANTDPDEGDFKYILPYKIKSFQFFNLGLSLKETHIYYFFIEAIIYLCNEPFTRWNKHNIPEALKELQDVITIKIQQHFYSIIFTSLFIVINFVLIIRMYEVTGD